MKRTISVALFALLISGCGGGSGSAGGDGDGDGDGDGGGGGGGGGGVVTVPTAPVLALTPQRTKWFRFTWSDVVGETEYRLLEDPDGSSGYTQIATIQAGAISYLLIDVALHNRINARYILRACNSAGCADSAAVHVVGTLAGAAGILLPSNEPGLFGVTLAMSADGSTLAIGAPNEDGGSTGVNGPQDSTTTFFNSGAVYVFTHSNGSWNQQAYIKASNTGRSDQFGASLALSADGNTLAVGATREDSSATGVNGAQDDDSAEDSGAVYVFARTNGIWSQQAYLKASNTEPDDEFGGSTGLTLSNDGDYGTKLALSADGNTLAVGAYGEDSSAAGINGLQSDNAALQSGAVYVFTRSDGSWSQQAYIKASNSGAFDYFGVSVALSGDGNTLAVGALHEDSSAVGLNGAENDNSSASSGAAYLFTRSSGNWSQQMYIKASNAGPDDQFGASIALSGDGNTLVVGAPHEDSGATGVNGSQGDGPIWSYGAVYVFTSSGGSWSQQAYVKASNADAVDYFGASVTLSADGNTLAAGAYFEDGNGAGVNGAENDNSLMDSGAVYVFKRVSDNWSQRAYVKAASPGPQDFFGAGVALSADGNTLAAGAHSDVVGGTVYLY